MPRYFQLVANALIIWSCLLVAARPAYGQSLSKLKRQAINRTHLTFVNGDTVQRFTVTYATPATRPDRFYYWQGPAQILRTAGAYNGHLLHGAYQLTSRNGNLLGSGEFAEGLKTGHWRTWRPDGTPVTSSYWRRGRQRGKTSNYDETGKLIVPVKVVAAASPAQPQKIRFWQPTRWWSGIKHIKFFRHTQKSTQLPTTAPSGTPANQPVPVTPASPQRPGS